MKKLFKKSLSLILWPCALVTILLRSFFVRWRIGLLNRRKPVIDFLAETPSGPPPRPRVLAVITHVVSEEDAKSGSPVKLARLVATLEGLLVSTGHCETRIFINTFEGRHVAAFLPRYLADKIELAETNTGDPTFVGFRAQDIFLQYRDGFDWFLFLEDDAVIHDSSLLDKLAFFNRMTDDPSILLLPHRYEVFEGTKVYIDMRWQPKAKAYAWNRFATFAAEGIKFGESGNPHAGFYCLNRPQLDRWEKTGRHWAGLTSYVGPLESAATGCLFEAFSLYQVHYDNARFLEVEHRDTKYSKQIAEGGF